MILELTGVTRRFGEVTAVDHLSLAIEPGEFVTLLGPSGCGKTTALRLIAGFEHPDEGTIRFRGSELGDQSPQRRGFGMVFQNYALFPHLDVLENVAFGLRSRGAPKAEIGPRVRRSLERVDLAGYEDRAVQALSGGQQQRVALARALAIEPPLLLLDEPLSNLDQALRVQTRTELRRLVKELEITALFVTHDQEEAFDLSDRIAVMEQGSLRQIGRPMELYRKPADLFVAGFMGRANFVPSRLLGADREADGEVEREVDRDADGDGAAEVVLVRPEEFEFVDEADGAIAGVVTDRRFRGPFTLYRIEGIEADPPSHDRDSHDSSSQDPPALEVAHRGSGPAVGERVRLRPRPGVELPRFRAERGR